jgi:hypothetical protein
MEAYFLRELNKFTQYVEKHARTERHREYRAHAKLARI